MEEEYLNSCTYGDLRKIARDYDILKTVKSKKKKALVDKLVAFFSENPGVFEALVPKESDSSPGGEVNSLFNSDSQRKSKRNQRNQKVPSDHESLLESEISTKLSDSSDETNRKENVSNPEIEVETSQIPEKKKGRGRKKKGSPKITDRRGTFTVSDATNELPKSAIDNSTVLSSKETSNFKKIKKSKESLSNTDNVQEANIASDLPDSSEEQETTNKKKNLSSSETEVVKVTSQSPEKNKKRGRGRKKKGKAVITDRRGTFTVSNDLPQSMSDNSNELTSKEANNFEKISESSGETEILSETNMISELHEGIIPNGERRGTFTLKTRSKNIDCRGQVSKKDKSSIGSAERKRKRADCEDTSNSDNPCQLNTQRTPKKAKMVQLVSPLITKSMNTPTANMKKNKIQVTTPYASKKSVEFMTPKSGVTPKRKNLPVTPHPVKKSLSTTSQKENTGQFSAKKMPNFSKIHKKMFEKMESLPKYAERKTARLEIFSPLNKTFTGLGLKGKSKLDSAERKPARSLIPIKSSRSTNHLNDIKNMKNLVKKIPSTTVDSIREKERSIIKGIRTNKRFMLQMQMRNLAS